MERKINLDIDTPEILHTFDGVIHVGAWHASALLGRKSIDNVLRAAALKWCRENGHESPRRVSSGATLNGDRAQTRNIYIVH